MEGMVCFGADLRIVCSPGQIVAGCDTKVTLVYYNCYVDTVDGVRGRGAIWI
jgi:hypothetical protein